MLQMGNGTSASNQKFRGRKFLVLILVLLCRSSRFYLLSFDLPREVVAVSLSLFDRYLATRGNDCNGNLALLTSLTTLHIAIKLNDSTKKIKLSTLSNLSRGQFGPKHIEKMEWEVLKALQWKLHPPTQSTFVSHLLLFLPSEVNPAARKSLNDLSKYLTELAVCDSYFVDINNSVVAFAAIVNVLEDMNYARFSGGLREKFLNTIACKVGFIYNAPDVVCARHRLRKIFASSTMMDNGAGQFAAQQQQFQHESSTHQHHVERDNVSLADRTMGSAGSVGSLNTVPRSTRSRTNSFDSSKGSCRGFSPSTRRPFVASVSPLASSRAARISSSPIVAGLQ